MTKGLFGNSHLAGPDTHTHEGCAGRPVYSSLSLLWFPFHVLNWRGLGVVVRGKGEAEVVRGEGERGPNLEERLSGSGGQPKGRILVLESQRGEEG